MRLPCLAACFVSLAAAQDAAPPQPRPGVPTLIVPDDLSEWRRISGSAHAQAPPGKEWVADAGGSLYVRESIGRLDLIYWKPGADNALVGYSGLAASAAEARGEAEEAVAGKIAALALARLGGFEDPRFRYFPRLASLLRGLAERLVGEAERAEVKDAFEESLERPYGTLHRAAVLASVEPQRIEELAEAIRACVENGYLDTQARLSDLVSAVGALLVVLLGLFAAYCLLRSGSAGALAWPLRAAALGVLALMGVFVYLLIVRAA